jgi:hypothetical protein
VRTFFFLGERIEENVSRYVKRNNYLIVNLIDNIDIYEQKKHAIICIYDVHVSYPQGVR